MTLLLLLLACADPTAPAAPVGPPSAAVPPTPPTPPGGAPGAANGQVPLGAPPLAGQPAEGPGQGPPNQQTHALPAEPPEGHNPRIPLLGRRPSEAERGEATIWIRGEVPGLKSGQVRFHAPDGDKLKVICLGEVVNGRYEAEAPPRSPDPVYVSVVALPDEEAVDAPHAWGALEAPLTLDGKDLVADLKIGARASWATKTEPAIDRIVNVDQVKSGP